MLTEIYCLQLKYIVYRHSYFRRLVINRGPQNKGKVLCQYRIERIQILAYYSATNGIVCSVNAQFLYCDCAAKVLLEGYLLRARTYSNALCIYISLLISLFSLCAMYLLKQQHYCFLVLYCCSCSSSLYYQLLPKCSKTSSRYCQLLP